MKGYRRFIISIVILLAIYIVAQINKPPQIDWKVTLSSTDKNPYGAYIVYHQLHDIFPDASIKSYDLPVYNQLDRYEDSNAAYVLLEPTLDLSTEDIEQVLNFVVSGNCVFMASANFNRILMDSLKFKTKTKFEFVDRDSTSINFNNATLKAKDNYQYHRLTLNSYFSNYDTTNTVVLGSNQTNDVNFIKIPYGSGAFFVHILPLCFSNDFMLTRSNASYTAKALSYLPANIHTLFWDEYYKQDIQKTQSPLRVILNDPWMSVAYYIGLCTIVLFVLFEMKRKQRIIPVIEPLKNTTLEFVKTIGNLYFNERNNKNIAVKKINYFLESLRSQFYLSTNTLNEDFIQALASKAGIPEAEVRNLVQLLQEIQQESNVSDQQLLELNRQVESFNSKINKT